jgi:hypothetical protein
VRGISKNPLMKKPHISVRLFAVRTGLEPATSAVTGRHSNQLNYRTNTISFDLGLQIYTNFIYPQIFS